MREIDLRIVESASGTDTKCRPAEGESFAPCRELCISFSKVAPTFG